MNSSYKISIPRGLQPLCSTPLCSTIVSGFTNSRNWSWFPLHRTSLNFPLIWSGTGRGGQAFLTRTVSPLSKKGRCFHKNPYKKMPMKVIVGTVSEDQFSLADKEVGELVKNALKKVHTKLQGPDEEVPVHPRSIQPDSVTGTLLNWLALPPVVPRVAKDGSISLLNSDKGVLSTLFYLLVNAGKFEIKKNVFLLNEGCDNGDVLGLVIPLLSAKGAENIKVHLVNGNEAKLHVARKFVSLLIPKENVSTEIINCFKDISEKLNEHVNYQKYFLFYRLVIVEKHSEIASFVESRLKIMAHQDVAFASFLFNDDFALQFAKNYKYELDQENLEEGYRVFKKNLPSKLIKKLQENKVEEKNWPAYLTAFEPKTICALIEKCKGEILHLSVIDTQTDEGTEMKVIGVIFKKNGA